MAVNLGTISKASAEVLRLPVDFGDVPQLIDGATGGAPDPLVLAVTISSFTVTCAGSGAPTVSSPQKDFAYQISALFSGGTPSNTAYVATYTITLNDADATVIQRTGLIQVTA